METLIINIPANKSALVKEVLMEFGVIIQKSQKTTAYTYKQKLAQVSVWTEDELKVFNRIK